MSAGICERCNNITNEYCTNCDGYVVEGTTSFIHQPSSIEKSKLEHADKYTYNLFCIQYENLNIDPKELKRILDS